MLIAAMERHGHLVLDPGMRERLEAISAATIDRILGPVRKQAGGRGRRRTAPSSAIRRAMPIRTYADWNDPPPGFFEADLVSHSGPLTSGSFAQTLVLTDIASGWTECAPLLFREQQLLTEVLTVLRGLTPLPILGFDTDNDTVFINETVKSWCETSGVTFTRSRPYRKNDQAHIEQKNGSVVRRMVGYRRFEGLAATEALARLYRPMRLCGATIRMRARTSARRAIARIGRIRLRRLPRFHGHGASKSRGLRETRRGSGSGIRRRHGWRRLPSNRPVG